jgi:DNA mismatch endonuclease, patch repair protein
VHRDRATDKDLKKAGWAVVRIWEHEEPSAAADQIAQVLQDRC